MCKVLGQAVTIPQAGGRIDVTITFYKERKLKPREGGLGLLSRCFVSVLLLTLLNRAIFFFSQVLKIKFLHTQSKQGLRHYPESHALATNQ